MSQRCNNKNRMKIFISRFDIELSSVLEKQRGKRKYSVLRRKEKEEETGHVFIWLSGEIRDRKHLGEAVLFVRVLYSVEPPRTIPSFYGVTRVKRTQSRISVTQYIVAFKTKLCKTFFVHGSLVQLPLCEMKERCTSTMISNM